MGGKEEKKKKKDERERNLEGKYIIHLTSVLGRPRVDCVFLARNVNQCRQGFTLQFMVHNSFNASSSPGATSNRSASSESDLRPPPGVRTGLIKQQRRQV